MYVVRKYLNYERRIPHLEKKSRLAFQKCCEEGCGSSTEMSERASVVFTFLVVREML
jgi:hypothetical protein